MDEYKFVPTKSDEIADKVKRRGGFVAFKKGDNQEGIFLALIKGLALMGITFAQATYNFVFNRDKGTGWIEAWKDDE